MPHSPEELRALVEERLEALRLWPELHGQAESVRYSITVGGKRVRPVICLATAEAAGGAPESALAAACALELVHTFSLVHDDLPALDDDEERRGQPSTWRQYGEAVGVLAGDALLAEAFRLATSYDTPHVARELAEATLGMIGGQYLDITGSAPDEVTLHSLKTGRLFAASVGLALWVAGVPGSGQEPWRAFGGELGLLFQIVDDILDVTGSEETLGKQQGSDQRLGKRTYVTEFGLDGARRMAAESHERAREALAAAAGARAGELEQITDFIATRSY
jgi:geranylgeranyl diphosphate synthase, type II